MGKKDEEKDLRKEVEMTEHTDSIEKVCQQYQTDGEKGLTDSAVEDVSYFTRISYHFSEKRTRLYVLSWLSVENFTFPSGKSTKNKAI